MWLAQAPRGLGVLSRRPKALNDRRIPWERQHPPSLLTLVSKPNRPQTKLSIIAMGWCPSLPLVAPSLLSSLSLKPHLSPTTSPSPWPPTSKLPIISVSCVNPSFPSSQSWVKSLHCLGEGGRLLNVTFHEGLKTSHGSTQSAGACCHSRHCQDRALPESGPALVFQLLPRHFLLRFQIWGSSQPRPH